MCVKKGLHPTRIFSRIDQGSCGRKRGFKVDESKFSPWNGKGRELVSMIKIAKVFEQKTSCRPTPISNATAFKSKLDLHLFNHFVIDAIRLSSSTFLIKNPWSAVHALKQAFPCFWLPIVRLHLWFQETEFFSLKKQVFFTVSETSRIQS